MPTVLITGGTGMIGRNLTRHLTQQGYDVIILSRESDSKNKIENVSYANWNVKQQKIDKEAIMNADFIVHLSGAGVMDKRWSKKYKEEIVNSRTKSSGLLVKGLKENQNNVKAVISASAIGWYGEDSKPLLHQNGFIETDPPDENFLGNTCKLWEESIEPVSALGKRLIKLRFGIVLSNDGGALKEFKNPVRFGIASILGSGKQVLSWIHIDDLCRMILFAIKNNDLEGSYNAVAPSPVNNKTLILKLAELLRKKFYIPVHVPDSILKLIMGERSIEILKSATVSAEKIKKTGFTFLYSSIDTALKELT